MENAAGSVRCDPSSLKRFGPVEYVSLALVGQGLLSAIPKRTDKVCRCNIPKIHPNKLLAKNIFFQNLFIAELESFPAIRRPDTKPNLRPDTKINHRLNFPYSSRSSRTSLLVDATPGSRPMPRTPPAPPFLFLPFPLFLCLLLFLFLLLSSFCFFPVLPRTLPTRGLCMPTRSMRGTAHVRPCAPRMLAAPLAPTRAVPSPCYRLAARAAAPRRRASSKTPLMSAGMPAGRPATVPRVTSRLPEAGPAYI